MFSMPKAFEQSLFLFHIGVHATMPIMPEHIY